MNHSLKFPDCLHIAGTRRLRLKFTGFIRCLALLLPLLLAACDDDDNPVPLPGEGENDEFLGEARSFVLGPETSGLTSSDVTLKILAPDGNIISRKCAHHRDGATSEFTLGSGLKDGTYRLLYVEYPIGDNPDLAHLADKYDTAQYGLGCRISVNGREIMVCDGFDDGIGLSGSGTKDDPYIISSYSHLIKLLKYVNNYETNRNITTETYFKQTNPIDMEQASFECDMRYGWLPIGADTNTPFRGVYIGDELSWLWIDRPTSAGVGLFGFVYNATIDGVNLSHADITGNYAVGALAGAVISAGNEHGKAGFTNCSVSQSKISGSDQSWGVGGLIGAVDMYAGALVQKSRSDESEVSGSYNVGGIIGGCGRFSSLTVGDCENSSTVTGNYSGTGGMVGVADTLNLVGCKNSGKIVGSVAFSSNDKNNSFIGTGGICGGSGISWLSACTNTGEIRGAYGVGGIIGSTRIKGGDGDAYMFNNTMLRWCSNSGNVTGQTCVGGMCGEAQFGGYGVVNSGSVTGGDYTAGIVGNTSIVVVHNAVNSGDISGGSYSSGIVGKTTWGSVALDHNYGKVTGGGSHTAGVIGLAGNNTIVNFCGNFGEVTGSGLAGGIVAEIGDPREWSAMDITECVVGSLEIVMAFAGPTIAIAEHAIEASAKGVAITLKLSEVVADAVLNIFDASIAAYDLIEILNPEKEEALKSSLHDVTINISDEIKSKISEVRTGFTNYDVGIFSSSPFTVGYNGSVDSNLAYYEMDWVGFNEKINRRREERMEELEKAHHSSEILHEAIAGVAIAASTAAMVAGFVVSGGAAAVVVIGGSAAAMVGGLNAISKGVMDFEENVVVISQCVNAGRVSSNGKAGGLVGVLQDNSLLCDCMNTADVEASFVYELKKNVRIERCLALDEGEFCKKGYAVGGENVYYDPSVTSFDSSIAWYNASEEYAMPMSAADIGVAEHYNCSGTYQKSHWSIDWIIGDYYGSLWKMGKGDGYLFPVPAYSEMKKY